MSNKKKRTPTISDVSKVAQVSTATVSRVLNGSGDVSEALALRVHTAVQRLGYVPNAGARALMVGTEMIGAVFPTLAHTIFATGIDALQERLEDDGLQLLIATSGYDPKVEEAKAQTLVRHGAQGIVLVGCTQTNRLLEFLRIRGTPCVHVMVGDCLPNMHCVGIDNEKAIMASVRHLVHLGHFKIAMLAGIAQDNDRASGRVAGFRRAMKEAGLEVPPSMILERPYDIPAAREGLRKLMKNDPAPTAVVCGNDVLAQGVLAEAVTMGLNVPDQLSIVGFDDLGISEHLAPPLTTIHVPTRKMWQMAAEQLLLLIRGELPDPIPPLDTHLVIRGTTSPPIP